MGWFGGLFGGGDGGGRSADPYAQLDPKLRQFLERESPVKYSSPVAETPAEAPDHAAAPPETATPAPAPPSAAAAVPAPSLYPDGRYADLWKTYRPLAEVEAATKSDHERLMDVLDAYQDRRAQIGRAALENCALEQLDWNNCIRSGPLRSRVTMCHAEMKKFERCYSMQSRLLKALGYLSTFERPPDEDERIQVHADALYHRMLDQEAALAAAKAEGREAPAISMDIGLPTSASVSAPVSPAPSATPEPPADLPPDMRQGWVDRLANVSETERPAEEAAMRAELQARLELTSRVTALRAAQAAEREHRKAEGKQTLSDRVSGLFGK